MGGRPLGEGGRAVLRVDWSDGVLRADGSLLGLAELSGGGPSTSTPPTSPSRSTLADLATLARPGRRRGLPEVTGSATASSASSARWRRQSWRCGSTGWRPQVGGTPLDAGEPVRLRLADGRLAPRLALPARPRAARAR